MLRSRDGRSARFFSPPSPDLTDSLSQRTETRPSRNCASSANPSSPSCVSPPAAPRSANLVAQVAIDKDSGRPLRGGLRHVRVPEGPASEVAAGADARREARLQDKRILQRFVCIRCEVRGGLTTLLAGCTLRVVYVVCWEFVSFTCGIRSIQLVCSFARLLCFVGDSASSISPITPTPLGLSARHVLRRDLSFFDPFVFPPLTPRFLFS